MSQALAMAGGSLRTRLQTVPGKLWLRQLLIAAATVVLAVASYRTHVFLSRVAQTVGKDAVPSIVAAEKIRTTLALANTNLANAFLTKEGDDGPAMRAYREAMASAHDSLLTAAQNITYGDEERKPILDVMARLAEYERLVGAARHAGSFDQSAIAADALMRDKILPAVVQLDQANFNHLDAAYSAFKRDAAVYRMADIALALLLLALLAETQLHLYRQFRRLINPSMALGTLLFVLGALMFASHSARELEDIRSAKEDAFDSIHALSRAKALAYTANAMESLYLLERGDAGTQAAEASRFVNVAADIWHGKLGPSNTLPTDLNTLKGTGLLGDELANITFVGEQEAATHTLDGWIAYMQIDEQIRKLEAEGKHAEAVALCLGKEQGESDWAFERFDQALDTTLKINQDAFDASIASAFAHVKWVGYSVFLLLLAPLFGAVVGIRQRLSEFRA